MYVFLLHDTNCILKPGVLTAKRMPADCDPELSRHDKHEESSDSDTNVRYVLSGKPTGWSAMATEVRNYDEERVKDTKEDIDTLLVFVRGLLIDRYR